MASFVTSNELNAQLEKLFESAEETILLISPFIKLHERYSSALRLKKDSPELEIIVVFGKNEENLEKSMAIEDLTFFTEFPNVEIRYEKRLHAKYYSNERFAILTSMNLHKYSHDNNIEFGIVTKPTILSRISKSVNKAITGDNIDDEALHYFERVIEQADLIYKKVPQYDKGIMRTGINKKYLNSTVEVDRIKETFTKIKGDINRSVIFEEKVTRREQYTPSMGFCIRTGKQIPFNPSQPLCYDSYVTWSSFANPEYPEKFCHFSGEPSNGETCFAKPILRKNWSRAMELFGDKMPNKYF